MAPTATRAARNEDQFRQLNESLEEWNEAHAWFDPAMPHWWCECAVLECSTAVALTLDEYRAVRSDPTHFLVAPSAAHVEPEYERVIARCDRYWVVEKVGEAGDVAERSTSAATDGSLATGPERASVSSGDMTSTQGELTISDVMLRRPKTLPADVTVADARTMLEKSSVKLLLLVDDGRFAGAVSRIPENARAEDEAIGFADKEPPVTTEADLPVTVALERLGRQPGGRLVVVDENRTLRGLVCLTASGDDFCGVES